MADQFIGDALDDDPRVVGGMSVEREPWSFRARHGRLAWRSKRGAYRMLDSDATGMP